MTSVLIQDFSERSKEVSKYFIFLRNLEQGATKLSMKSMGDNPSKIKVVDPELLKTLKASAFLLLYNLVEATMRNVIAVPIRKVVRSGCLNCAPLCTLHQFVP
jgi:hypothetical protein